jgi:hypothetical protein
MSTVCKTCVGPIKRAGETRSGLALWVHLNGALDHDAIPQPRCLKCDSFNFAFYETNWGYGWRCGDCGRDEYYSIGD